MNIKNLLYEQVAAVGKAIASPKRLEILDCLTQGEKTVEALADHAGISIKLASAHLQDLKTARLVEARRDGRFIYYRVADSEVVKVLVDLRVLAERRLDSIRDTLKEYFRTPETMSTMDRNTLIKKAQSGDVIVIDVRPQDEFNAGHLPYARSVPLTQLKRMFGKLPKNKEIVAYCRGSYCVLSRNAAKTLRGKGFRATYFSEGISEWIASGIRLVHGRETV